MGARVPLRHYRMFSRAPYIDLDADQTLHLHLPTVFGRREFSVPAPEVGVVNQSGLSSADDDGDGWVYKRPVRIPYAATTSPNVAPNLTLLFATPQRIPAVRVGGAMTLNVSWRESRSVAGVHVDGIALRAVEPAAAVATLVAAGVNSVERPNAWLRAHREVSVDPVDIQSAVLRQRRWRWVSAIFTAVAIGFVALRFFANDTSSNAVLVAAGVGVAAVYGLPIWAKRRDKQSGPPPD